MTFSLARLQGMVMIASAASVAAVVPGNAKTPGVDCSRLVVNHSYSQEFSGFLNLALYYQNPNGGLVPSAGTGFVTFRDGGKVAGQITLAIGSVALVPDIVFDGTSTYSLSWDTSRTPPACVGTMNLKSGPMAFNFEVTVPPDARYIDMIHADTGLIVGVRGYPVETSGCNSHTLNGKYSHNMSGWALPQTSLPPGQLLAGYAPFAFSGVMNLEPQQIPGSSSGGEVVWWETGSIDGSIVHRSGVGSYTLSPNCKGLLVLVDSSKQSLQLEFYVGKDGHALYLVNTNPPTPTGAPVFVLGMTANRIEHD